ncbi:iron ABC transporter substrate-binding protein [Actinophytocola sp.]|uniref:iron ABC transporter substrate-binding protein n=1 Tax=Actinophytocola sp. TaxID=1872138 RepID=UPI003D6A1002
MGWSKRWVAVVSGLALLTAGCGDAAGDGPVLTLYNAQHEDLMRSMVDGFTEETGIRVEFRQGADFELANQIVQEGDASPADVFATENSPAMSLVDSEGGFARLDDATVAQVPTEYVPSSRNWTGFAARATVLVYNTDALTEAELPKSIMDLARPEWRDRIGVAAAGADFQAIVSAVLEVEGEAATAKWLSGLKTNAGIYEHNIATMTAVNAGEIDAGVIYHYYWYKDQAESGKNSANTKLKYFGGKDPGAFLSVSGIGVVKASDDQQNAQRLVKYLTSEAGQQIMSDGGALEYSIASDVAPNSKLKPLAELDAPEIDVAKLNGPKVVELMQNAGLL